MIIGTLQSLISPNEKELAAARKILKKIKSHEESVRALSDYELSQSTKYFREKLGVDMEKLLSDDIYFNEGYPAFDKKELQQERKKLFELMPEAYARVREAARRVAKHEHFDVQLMTGILLAKSKITEVYTGEGKTNSALLPAFLYGLTGKGVHVATANDYLARRDGEWAGQILLALGMTSSIITPQESFKIIDDKEAVATYGEGAEKTLSLKDMANMSTMNGANLKPVSKKEAYKSDVIYGQASEFGFDYLRDNMANTLESRNQRYFYFSIVDECDSILIDEARTPLIISTPDTQPSEIYYRFATIAKELKHEEDYEVDEKRHSVVLTDSGILKVEKALGIENVWAESKYIKHIDNALKAKALFNKDKEYIVTNGEVQIVDQFTGRVQPGRRYSEGLHQAIEAKEKVEIKTESKTLATISYQNYFRMYAFLSGMTGTAMTEAEEFAKIYSLDVVRVPTHKKLIREDLSDVIYKSEKAKFDAVVKDIEEKYAKGQPVLAGTTSIEKSEYLSQLLRRKGIPHQVLNAKLHDKEAKIVASSGLKANVTIATNMAGRGTDIKLSPEVKEIGGLHIIGTERHEARRIDNQLRGRSGRLGDPGSSRFYLSLEDRLMRVFGGDLIKNLIGKQLPEDVPLESRFLTGVIKNSQQKVESLNFDIRKRLVDYDDVLNQQREIVYKMRRIMLQQLHSVKTPAFNRYIIDKKYVEFAQALSAFSIKRYTNQKEKILDLVKDTFLQNPQRLWILKQIFDQILHIVGDVKEKKSLSQSTYKIFIDFLDTIMPNQLQEKTAQLAGFKSYQDFIAANTSTKGKSTTITLPAFFQFIVDGYYLQIQHLSAHVGDKEYERYVIMSSLDYLWMEHIDAMTDLREGIGFRGYAQRDPLVEYKREATTLFNNFFDSLADMIARKTFRVEATATKQQNTAEQIKDIVAKSFQSNNSKKKKKK